MIMPMPVHVGGGGNSPWWGLLVGFYIIIALCWLIIGIVEVLDPNDSAGNRLGKRLIKTFVVWPLALTWMVIKRWRSIP